MDAGANEAVTRTEAKKYCPQINVGGRAVTNLINTKNALKVFGRGVGRTFFKKFSPQKIIYLKIYQPEG
jgi:hypothetical protein